MGTLQPLREFGPENEVPCAEFVAGLGGEIVPRKSCFVPLKMAVILGCARPVRPSKTIQEGEAGMSAKYIFVTGGVVSSLGKGLAAASIGCLLESRGLRINLMKFDPYLNVDPGVIERHSETNWLRVEIDFSGELDEAFGVAANKQGVRLKDYMTETIAAAIGSDIASVREEIRRVQAKRATERKGSRPSPSEARATETDVFQTERLDAPLSPEEEEQMQANLRGLAVALKSDGETDDEAFQRVTLSKFLITFRDDPYWPFYHVEHKFGRVILTINTAHPFFEHLYKPLRDLEIKEAVEGQNPPDHLVPSGKGPVTALELLLFSMARTQSVLSRENQDAPKIFDAFRRAWSEAYRIQLTN